MKKTYIITFQHVLNYGAVLQAYALAKFLNENEIETEVLDYRPSYFVYQTYRPRKGLGKTYNKFLKNIRFYKFRRNFLPLTKKIFFNTNALKSFFKTSSGTFICGSDQVWNSQLTKGKLDTGYFLDFLPKTAKKVAYAASMGNSAFKESDRSETKRLLKNFNTILVREDFAQDQVSKITNNECASEIVVDPTLLIQDYSEVLDFSLVPDHPYLVSYLTEDSKPVREYINKIKEMTGLPLINLGHHEIKEADKNYLYESPSKWLGVFSKATIVCTNSFHGNAYSLIFKRNFTVFTRVTKKQLNRRQLTLLERLGIEDRFISRIEDLKDLHLEPINYNKVSPKYNDLVNLSKRKLLNALRENI
ncbi:polysaccharide pyruvyl transferase family protein [Winogradskyella immobilis]|uniref:Polysaccharide pyruvyl transferase family protein n=1 Tax=Winogradskyella immobilis TaxID=2816852 RepID=A0ABS8EJW0_9FLAO|nr:polysaccharide pyruvyl transferase family protein [Winogradskyella immobilis]MCC1483484.1 polysaccharide pyruvyl transferase family protein [Winogradskyella immobilis]MCG0015578.1 polysaccharide pyruvyl transferase family protein [Winogradskyella immobilis]